MQLQLASVVLQLLILLHCIHFPLLTTHPALHALHALLPPLHAVHFVPLPDVAQVVQALPFQYCPVEQAPYQTSKQYTIQTIEGEVNKRYNFVNLSNRKVKKCCLMF